MLEMRPMPEPTVTSAGMRLVKLLVGTPPQTVSDLIRAAGVTRTAVAEQLNELVAAGLVTRSTERLPGRGRPRHLYSATQAALLLLFANGQRLVVPAIWQAIGELGGDPMVRKVVKRVGRIIAEHYKCRITAKTPQKRLEAIARLLVEEGGLVETVAESGQLVLRRRSCPFISMIDERRSVCAVDQDMLSEVVGRPVRRITCRHDGDPCCTFEIVNGLHR